MCQSIVYIYNNIGSWELGVGIPCPFGFPNSSSRFPNSQFPIPTRGRMGEILSPLDAIASHPPFMRFGAAMPMRSPIPLLPILLPAPTSPRGEAAAATAQPFLTPQSQLGKTWEMPLTRLIPPRIHAQCPKVPFDLAITITITITITHAGLAHAMPLPIKKGRPIAGICPDCGSMPYALCPMLSPCPPPAPHHRPMRRSRKPRQVHRIPIRSPHQRNPPRYRAR